MKPPFPPPARRHLRCSRPPPRNRPHRNRNILAIRRIPPNSPVRAKAPLAQNAYYAHLRAELHPPARRTKPPPERRSSDRQATIPFRSGRPEQ